MKIRCLIAIIPGLLLSSVSVYGQELVVGSKKFTENVILGEIATLALGEAGYNTTHRAELGGTRILWNALLTADINVYPEYTGTILEEIFAGAQLEERHLADTLAALGIGITDPLGFNNTYALGITRETAARTGIKTISDLSTTEDLVFGFSDEFLARGDGWPALQAAYSLDPDVVRGLDHDIAYRGLDGGSIDVIDLYSTDAEIKLYDLVVLEDDRLFFPRYDAVYLYRLDAAPAGSPARDMLNRIAGAIDEGQIIEMNARARVDRTPPVLIATDFLSTLGITPQNEVTIDNRWTRILDNTRDHLVLVLVSLLAAILVSIPLGVLAARNRLAGSTILAIVGGLYTIPSLALLVFMIPLLGIGAVPAIVALFLYSLLPIVRNTHSGLTTIAPELIESAEALGLDKYTRLRRIELPLASQAILAGIKTSAVINIGTATLGALIGAGGLGQPILTGIRLNDTGLILEGAVPAALLAFLAQWIFDLSEKVIVPAGLRLES